MATSNTKITLFVPTGMLEELRGRSRRDGRPVSELIRDAIDRFLAEQQCVVPGFVGSVADGSLDATQAKRWVRERWTANPTRGRKRRAHA